MSKLQPDNWKITNFHLRSKIIQNDRVLFFFLLAVTTWISVGDCIVFALSMTKDKIYLS